MKFLYAASIQPYLFRSPELEVLVCSHVLAEAGEVPLLVLVLQVTNPIGELLKSGGISHEWCSAQLVLLMLI